MKTLRYIGPLDQVSVVLHDGTEIHVERNATFQVPDDVAGSAPTAAWLAAMEAYIDAQHAEPRVHETIVAAKEALIAVGDQAGAQLLQQIANYELVTPARTTKTTTTEGGD